MAELSINSADIADVLRRNLEGFIARGHGRRGRPHPRHR